MSKITEGILAILDVIGAEAAQQTERIDNLEKHCEAMDARLDRFAIELSGKVNVRTDPPKRVIKGGWYIIKKSNTEEFPYYSTGPWKDQETARARASVHPHDAPIAIVQMPDITEGDGL